MGKTKKQLAKSLKKSILESVDPTSREHSVITLVKQLEAETVVNKRVLDVEMLKLSWMIIDNEHRALLATNEQAASNESVDKMMKPNQQFASTHF